jgi:hypothetical protein
MLLFKNVFLAFPTIIDRAKKNDFYLRKKRKKTVHVREVLTNYAGEVIQHDVSHHLWAAAAKEKWYLIASIDDFQPLFITLSLSFNSVCHHHCLVLESIAIFCHIKSCPYRVVTFAVRGFGTGASKNLIAV